MSVVTAILAARLRAHRAALFPLTVRRAISIVAIVVILAGFVLGGFVVFMLLLELMSGFDIPNVTDHLLSIVALAFFLMLVVSNAIMTLSSLYLAPEIGYLFSFPISRRSVFAAKLIESGLYSSWAFLAFGTPILLAYGVVTGADWYFYPLVFLVAVPFLAIATVLGSAFTMLVARFVPARNTRLFYLVLIGAMVLTAVVFVRMEGVDRMLAARTPEDLTAYFEDLKLSRWSMLPSHWLAQSISSAAQDASQLWRSVSLLFCVACLATWALLASASRLYYRGWAESHAGGRKSRVAVRGLLDKIERYVQVVAPWIRPPTRALLVKDLKVFWRDPTQWLQLIVLAGLLLIYAISLPYRGLSLEADDQWRVALLTFNLGTSSFVLATIAARFVFPAVSLEGRNFWVVGTAPFALKRLIWQKYWTGVVACAVIGEAVMLLSCWSLGVGPLITVFCAATALLVSLGLVSISIGMGAMLPNFDEPNAAKIASGAGGTINILVCLTYVVLTVACASVPLQFYVVGRSMVELPLAAAPLVSGVLVGVTAVAITVPLALGFRAVERFEF
jgi:ABC-2 type transport system permease protein